MSLIVVIVSLLPFYLLGAFLQGSWYQSFTGLILRIKGVETWALPT